MSRIDKAIIILTTWLVISLGLVVLGFFATTEGAEFAKPELDLEIIDNLFQDICRDTPFDWHLIKAQCIVESDMKLDAVGKAGEEGPMQLMPNTVERMGVTNTFDWENNVGGAVAYMEHLYELFCAKRVEIERIKFTLAAYNCGVGYIDIALRFARHNHISIKRWDDVKKYLSHSDCQIGGRRPNAKQIIRYVEEVMREYEKLKGGNDAT